MTTNNKSHYIFRLGFVFIWTFSQTCHNKPLDNSNQAGLSTIFKLFQKSVVTISKL